MGDDILVEKRGAVRLITINRPSKMNSLDFAANEALVAAFRGFEEDEDARVAVISSTAMVRMRATGTQRMTCVTAFATPSLKTHSATTTHAIEAATSDISIARLDARSCPSGFSSTMRVFAVFRPAAASCSHATVKSDGAVARYITTVSAFRGRRSAPFLLPR